jgi:hypothetical protein
MEVSDQLMPKPLYPLGICPKYPLNEAEWTLEPVCMFSGEEKISAGDSTMIPQLVQFIP